MTLAQIDQLGQLNQKEKQAIYREISVVSSLLSSNSLKINGRSSVSHHMLKKINLTDARKMGKIELDYLNMIRYNVNGKGQPQKVGCNTQSLDSIRLGRRSENILGLQFNVDEYVDIQFMEKSLVDVHFFSGDIRRQDKTLLILKTDFIFRFWSILILIVIIFLLLYLPIQFAQPDLSEQPLTEKLDLVIWIVFLIDIALNFIIATEDKYGRKIYDYQQIAKSYMSQWFIIDLISVIELKWFINSSTISKNAFLNNYAKITKLRFAQLNKAFKSMKILNLLKHDEYIGWLVRTLMSKKNVKVIFPSLILVIFCHFYACIYVGSAMNTQSNDHNSWYKVWLAEKYTPGMQFDIAELYIISWYLAIQTVTTVGYGDVPTTNNNEMLCKVFGMLIGTFLWSFVSANIISYSVDDAINKINQREVYQTSQRLINRYNINFEGIDKISKTFLVENDNKLAMEYNFVSKYMSYKDQEMVFKFVYNYYNKIVKPLNNKSYMFFMYIYPHLVLKQYQIDTYLDYTPEKADKYRKNFIKANEDTKLLILVNGEVGKYDSLCEYYNLTFNGVFYMHEQGDLLNMDKIVYNKVMQFDVDYIVYENSELIELDFKYYAMALQHCYSGDTRFIESELVETHRAQLNQYLKNKLYVWYSIIWLKFTGFYVKEYDFHVLENKIGIEKFFIILMMKMLKKNTPVIKEKGFADWFHAYINTPQQNELNRYAGKLTKHYHKIWKLHTDVVREEYSNYENYKTNKTNKENKTDSLENYIIARKKSLDHINKTRKESFVSNKSRKSNVKKLEQEDMKLLDLDQVDSMKEYIKEVKIPHSISKIENNRNINLVSDDNDNKILLTNKEFEK